MTELQAAVSVFGRGTAAGDAIYRCYARPVKESTLDPDLLARLERRRREREAAEAAMLHPRPVPKSKAMVSCPRVGVGSPVSPDEIARRRLDALPQKKREDVIRRQLRARSPPTPPTYSRPPITSTEKERLGQIFQFGEVPLRPVNFTGVNKARYGMIDRRFRLKDRFETLRKQVDALREELRQLKEQQKLKSTATDGCSEGGKDGENGCIATAADMRMRFNRRDPLKALERRILEQELTRNIGDAVREMKGIDEDLRYLSEMEMKQHGLKL